MLLKRATPTIWEVASVFGGESGASTAQMDSRGEI